VCVSLKLSQEVVEKYFYDQHRFPEQNHIEWKTSVFKGNLQNVENRRCWNSCPPCTPFPFCFGYRV